MRKGHIMSPAQRRHLSRVLSTPEARKKKSEITKAGWQDPEERERRIDGLQRAWADPEKRERIMGGIRRSWDNPKIRKRHIRGIKRSAKRPEVRKAKSDSMKVTLAKPEVRERIKKAHDGQWDDPKKVEQMKKTLARTLADPKVKKRKSDAAKKMWDGLTPEQHDARVEKMHAKIKAVWAADRALAPVIPISGANRTLRDGRPKIGRTRKDDLAARVEELKPSMSWPQLTRKLNEEARRRGQKENSQEAYRSLLRSRKPKVPRSSAAGGG
jgi:hypothetical protein